MIDNSEARKRLVDDTFAITWLVCSFEREEDRREISNRKVEEARSKIFRAEVTPSIHLPRPTPLQMREDPLIWLSIEYEMRSMKLWMHDAMFSPVFSDIDSKQGFQL